LIDALCGCGDLPTAVRAVTDLPVTVALTHCHFDHIGGGYFFPEVLLSEQEQPQWAQEAHHLAALREEMVDRNLLAPQELWCLRDGKTPVCRDVREGNTLDLGGLIVKATALPGHTAGSMGYFCPELELLFSGDAVTPIMCLFFPESGPISQYRETLKKMERLPIRAFYTGHHANSFSKATLADFQECAAFAQSDRGMYWQHDILPEYRGTLHVYRGSNSEAEDFLALISRRD
jgi:glyoxylase-like metal-dependent hydrolase (beta-lactamase superfamily II)